MKYFNMSRMVKKLLPVIGNVSISKNDGFISVSNDKGTILINTNNLVDFENTDNNLKFISLTNEDNGMLGTIYVLVKDAMQDLTNGYEAKLKMIGVGFKASVNGKFLRLYIGLSHDVVVAIPDGLSVSVDADVNINIKGYDRAKVKQFACSIRSLKKPEPYKGKGIFLNDEKIIRKEGKKK